MPNNFPEKIPAIGVKSMMTRYLLAATVALLPLPALAQAAPAATDKSSDQIKL